MEELEYYPYCNSGASFDRFTGAVQITNVSGIGVPAHTPDVSKTVATKIEEADVRIVNYLFGPSQQICL